MDTTVESKELRKAGLKVTLPRVKILEMLEQSRTRHLSAEEVYKTLLDSGEDMELHGAVPDVIVWPEPCQQTRGEDAQLAKGVEVLLADVKAWKERPQLKLKKASER